MGWTRHEGTISPALAPAALIDSMETYLPLTDPEGVQYCSAEGLEPWAEYVATGRISGARQYQLRPRVPEAVGPVEWVTTGGFDKRAPMTHYHPGRWQDSLMRVWRGE